MHFIAVVAKRLRNEAGSISTPLFTRESKADVQVQSS